MSRTVITLAWPAVPGATLYTIAKNGSVVASTKTATTAKVQVANADAITVAATVPAPAPAPTPAPSPPAPATGTGLGILMYRGNLGICSHLADGTYDLAIASWKDPALAGCSGEKYNYTIMKGTPGWDLPGYVVFDPADTSGWLTQVASLPAGQGVFVDNFISTIPGVFAALEAVSPKVRAAGRKLCVNAGAAISNDGSTWIAWAKQLVPYVDRIMFEHSQMVYLSASTTPAGNGEQPRTRGTAWWQNWDAYQNAPAACVEPATGLSKYVGIAYGTVQNAVYSRASLLLAPQSRGAVFIYSNGDGYDTGTSDPYAAAWTMAPVHPTVDPVAATATL